MLNSSTRLPGSCPAELLHSQWVPMHPSGYPTLNAGLHNCFWSIMRLLVNPLLQCPEGPWCNTPILQSIRCFPQNFMLTTSLLKVHSISSCRGSEKTWNGTIPEEYCLYTSVRTSSYWPLLFQSNNPDSSSLTLQYIHTVCTFSVCLQVDYVRSCQGKSLNKGITTPTALPLSTKPIIFIAECNQVGQSPFAHGKTTLAISKHFLVLHIPENGFRKDLLHDVPTSWGKTD